MVEADMNTLARQSRRLLEIAVHGLSAHTLSGLQGVPAHRLQLRLIGGVLAGTGICLVALRPA